MRTFFRPKLPTRVGFYWLDTRRRQLALTGRTPLEGHTSSFGEAHVSALGLAFHPRGAEFVSACTASGGASAVQLETPNNARAFGLHAKRVVSVYA